MRSIRPLGSYLFEFDGPRPVRPVGPFGIKSVNQLPNLAAWYDASDRSSMVIDGSNRVALIADKSGNSGTNCLVLNGVAGSNNSASSPDSAPLRLGEAFGFDVDVALNSWTPAANNTFLAKWDSTSNQRSYLMRVNTDGTLTAQISIDGTSGTFLTWISTVATGFSAFARKRVRFLRNGATGRFFVSDDGITWTQLGANVTAATGSPLANNQSLFVGAVLGTSDPTAGRVYRVRIYSDEGTTVAFDANFTNVAKLATSFVESSSNAATVTINTSGDLGARISGERDLYQGTVSKQPIYLPFAGEKYGYLRGASGVFFSTPDSNALDVLSGFDIRLFLRPATWTPSGNLVLISKTSSASERSWRLTLTTSGTLSLAISSDGSAESSAASAALGFGATDDRWVRVTRDSSTGVIQFFTSMDGASWTQSGSNTTLFTDNLFNNSAPVEIGSWLGGASANATGRIYRAQIYNGAAELVADFNPALYTSGTTFTASTGETWTLNGGATIVDRTTLYFDGSDDYMKAPAFSLSQPETVYFVGQQVTWTQNDPIFDGNSTNSLLLYQRETTPGLRFTTNSTNILTQTNLPLAQSSVVTVCANDNASLLKINRTPSTTGNAGNVAASGFTLGAGAAAFQPSNIRVSEIAIFAAAHDTALQDVIIPSLQRKWNIA